MQPYLPASSCLANMGWYHVEVQLCMWLLCVQARCTSPPGRRQPAGKWSRMTPGTLLASPSRGPGAAGSAPTSCLPAIKRMHSVGTQHERITMHERSAHLSF